MIIRSDWRGEPRNTSAPKRAISKRDADIDIISIAQQAKPNDIGQIEFLRAQLIALDRVVVKIPSDPRSSSPALSIRANRSAGPLASGLSSISFIFSWDPALLHSKVGKLATLPGSARPGRRALGHRTSILGHLGASAPDAAGN